MNSILRVRNISKGFLTNNYHILSPFNKKEIKAAVDNVSFDVFEGEVFALLGPNGAGKTTLLRMLSTLLVPDSGHAYLRETDIFKNPIEIRRNIGFLTSELRLDPFLTPDYMFDFSGKLYGLEQLYLKKRKNYLFKKFGIEKYSKERFSNLSTGMKQKVSLVIALVNDPDILILDEPTNGLDLLSSNEIIKFLMELKKEKRTIILSTHIFSLVYKTSDKIAIMVEGKIECVDKTSNFSSAEAIERKFFDLYNGEDLWLNV